MKWLWVKTRVLTRVNISMANGWSCPKTMVFHRVLIQPQVAFIGRNISYSQGHFRNVPEKMTEMDRLPVPHLAALCQHLLQLREAWYPGRPDRSDCQATKIAGGYRSQKHGTLNREHALFLFEVVYAHRHLAGNPAWR